MNHLSRHPVRLFFTPSRLVPVALGAVILFLAAGMGEALAGPAKQFGDVQESIGRDVGLVPKFMAIVSYVIGVFFASDGLLKLKAWMDDSQKNPINPAIFRLGVAALLIWLPYGMTVANYTLFGSNSGGSNTPYIPPPRIGVFEKTGQ